MAGAVFAAVLLATLAGAAALGHASTRTISDFTLTGCPSPATYGKQVAYTMHFRNASTQPIVHVVFRGKASSADANASPAGSVVFSTSSSSQGTCAAHPNDSALAVCDFGKVLGGATVDATVVFTAPSAASGAVKLIFDANAAVPDGQGNHLGLSFNESGGDPGQTSLGSPDPASLSFDLQARDGSHSSDILTNTNKTVSTTTVVAPAANRTS